MQLDTKLREGTCRRDLSWHTYHIWHKLCVAELGRDRVAAMAEALTPLPGDAPADYHETKEASMIPRGEG